MVLVTTMIFGIVVSGPAADEGIPLWQYRGIPPAAYASEKPLSAARWIWSSPRCQRNQAVSFRQRFELGTDTEVRLQIRADDIIDAAYLNGVDVKCGTGVPDAAFAKAARPGANLLALRIRNGSQIAGVIYRVLGRNDARVCCASSSAVKCADEPEGEWWLPEYDDASWHPAYEHGDVTMPPWSRHNLGFVKSFMTDDEWSGYQTALRTSLAALPASLADEPEPEARIVYRGWLPKINVSGRDLEPNFNLPLAIDFSPYVGSNMLKLDSLGFSIVRVAANDGSFYRGEGEPCDFTDLDWQARRLLTMAPEVRMEVNLVFDAMTDWCRKHPEECVGYAAGPVDPGATETLQKRVLRPSAASSAFREEMRRVIDAFGSFVRSRPWGKRVIAVRVSYGVYTEWHTYCFGDGPDTGVAMTREFRRYLVRKYGDDAALAKAWNEPEVTLATAVAPTMEERGPSVAVLDPKTQRKTLDFFDCNAQAMADLLIHAGGCVKRALPGRLVGAYYGYVLEATPPEGMNALVDRVLSSPALDYLTNPPAYASEHRRAGGAFTTRNVPFSYHRYGKLCVCEDDMRHHHAFSYDVDVPFGARTPAESKATAKRNYLNRLFDGSGLQALDLTSGCRPGAFDDPVVLEGFHEAIAETAAAGDPGIDSGNELAVVLDYRGRLKLGDRPGRTEAVNRYSRAPQQLYRTGMTFDMLTLDDYLATEQRYRRVLFLNPGEADAELLAKARTKAAGADVDFDPSIGTVAKLRAFLERLAIHAWTGPDNYVRHHGRLLMFHTGRAGRHEIRLPADWTGAVSLTTGRVYEGPVFVVETSEPWTELFRLK